MFDTLPLSPLLSPLSPPRRGLSLARQVGKARRYQRLRDEVRDLDLAQSLIAANLEHCGVSSGYAIIPAGLTRALATLPADETTPAVVPLATAG